MSNQECSTYIVVTIAHIDAEYPTDTSEIYVDFSKKYKPQPVTNMWQEAGDGEVLISWTRTNQSAFSAYDIEKSEDGKSWKKLNKRPYVSSFEKNEKAFIYVDSMVVNNKNYSYRLRGYTPFGDQGLYSEIIKSTPIDLTPRHLHTASKPQIMGALLRSNGKQLLMNRILMDSM
jgi:hypothetical protein